jgi:phosphoribosylanthranilate isomerase
VSLKAVKVKVCGITDLADAEKALEFGADMLGFNFYPPSPRSVAPEKAREIIERLPAGSFNVALFVNAAKARVEEVLALGRRRDGSPGYRALQFHGEESADFCRGWGLPIIKAFRMKERASLAGIKNFPADFCLLDSWTEGYGGSGAPFPWEWLEGLDADKIILSGGLNAENVADAIKKIRPYGVDVCSGVEARPGIKDHVKLKEFISAAKAA